MGTITSVDGPRIAYERTGSGPLLVLVHGTTADPTRWAPVRHAFDPVRFAEVTVPTLLLSGGERAACLRHATDAVDDTFPNSEPVVIDGPPTRR